MNDLIKRLRDLIGKRPDVWPEVAEAADKLEEQAREIEELREANASLIKHHQNQSALLIKLGNREAAAHKEIDELKEMLSKGERK